jgi:hypothetical protein
MIDDFGFFADVPESKACWPRSASGEVASSSFTSGIVYFVRNYYSDTKDALNRIERFVAS